METSEPNVCKAITANGNPCKKKSKKNECYCNTHLSSTTKKQKIEKNNSEKRGESKKINNTREVEIREIRGIPYYIDGKGNVYKHEEIQQENPSIIGKFIFETGLIEFC